MSAPPTKPPKATAMPMARDAREQQALAADRERYVRERLNFQVFTLGRATQAVALVAAILLWGAFYWATRDVRVLVWAALVHCAQALRYAGFAGTARRYPASRYPDALPSEAIRHVSPLLLVTSFVWGTAPWLLTPANGAHDAQLPVLAIFLFGMIAGSIPAIMPMPALVAVWLVPLTLSRLRSPARIACMSPEVSKVLSIRYPSMMDMPPPCPWVVTRGIPARHRASTSRWMVRRDTSKVRAS